MNLYDLQIDFHEKVLSARAIELILLSDKFEVLYSTSSPEELEDLDKVLSCLSKKELKKWMASHSQTSLNSLPVRDLHGLGSQYGVPYYAQLTKSALIKEIEKARKVYNEKTRDARTNGTTTEEHDPSTSKVGESETVSDPSRS